MLHRSGSVITQRALEGKSNEITSFAPLLSTVAVSGMVITANDELTTVVHTERNHIQR